MQITSNPGSVSSLTRSTINPFRSVETQTEVMETQNLASPPDYKKFLKE